MILCRFILCIESLCLVYVCACYRIKTWGMYDCFEGVEFFVLLFVVQSLRVPAGLQEAVDRMSLTIRAKPFHDTDVSWT